MVGDGDEDGKNFSLLHERNGALRLAPLYDVMSTLFYRDDRLAMFIDSVQRTDRVTAERIVNEAVRWGMARTRAGDIVNALLDAVLRAQQRAADETGGVPPEIMGIVSRQLDRLRAT